MDNIRKQFIELLNIHGVSGDEGRVKDYLKPHMMRLMGMVSEDHYGNLLASRTFGSGETTLMLSAHMDTVAGVLADRCLIEDDGLVHSDKGALGADDRAGIAIILGIMEHLDQHPVFDGVLKVVFTREEEIGCVGSYQLKKDFYCDVDLAIVVDRRGTRDIVVGNSEAFCSNDVGWFLEKIGKEVSDNEWRCVRGGVSDALTYANNGINAVNLSAGYFNEHTEGEYADLESMQETAEFILRIFANMQAVQPTFEAVSKHNHWVPSKKDAWVESETADAGMQLYRLDGGDAILKQGSAEMYLSATDVTWLLERLNNEKELV